jgi:hypothetical protein
VTEVLGFQLDEYIWLAHREDDGTPAGRFVQDEAVRVRDLIEPRDEYRGYSLAELLTINPAGDLGTYYAVNLLKSPNSRTADNVSRFLYSVVEHDDCPKEEQLAMLHGTHLPIRTIVDSGGKSLHAIVKIEADKEEEYSTRVLQMRQYIDGAGFDRSTTDPLRFTRLPGCVNGDRYQRMLSRDCGADSFQQWELRQLDDSEWFSIDDLMSFDREQDPDCLIGKRWICKGGSFVIQGYTGFGKSSLALQIAMSWVLGCGFFNAGRRCDG